jgi:hypothetical protein
VRGQDLVGQKRRQQAKQRQEYRARHHQDSGWHLGSLQAQTGIVTRRPPGPGTRGRKYGLKCRRQGFVLMQTTNANTQIRRPRPAAYVALLAFALFQLGFALHQAEHAVADLDESCIACSYFNGVAPAPAAAEVQVTAALADPVLPAPTVVANLVHRYPIHARAPPFA